MNFPSLSLFKHYYREFSLKLSCRKLSLVYLFIWLYQVLAAARGIFSLHYSMQDLFQLWHVRSSSLTRDQTQASCTESIESQPLAHQGNPPLKFLFLVSIKFPSTPLLQLLVLLLFEIFVHSFKFCLSVYYLALILFRFSVKLSM